MTPASDSTDERAVERHYASDDLAGRIRTMLVEAGLDPDALTLDDIAPFDEFHIGGRGETLELIRLAGLTQGCRVLDVGSGVGGPARTLASLCGADVTGLDLTRAFCEAATMLTADVGLSDRVRFRHGSALDMPFDDGSFDAAWIQHATMNIGDKQALSRELHRVLRPGGRVALHEILAGEVAPIHFPVFWADRPELSFLPPPVALRGALEEAGFTIEAWNDVTARSEELMRTRFGAPPDPDAPKPLGFGVIVPRDVPVKGANVLRNLREGRITVVQAVARKN